MISPATQSKLSLLLPQNNKVLNELIKHATPDQLATLNDKRDLKSLLGTLLTHKIDSTKSDALLLNMLKNSPAFKNMGNFTDTLKSLIGDLKSNPTLENSANKLLRATTPIQSDAIGQKIIAMLESTQPKANLLSPAEKVTPNTATATAAATTRTELETKTLLANEAKTLTIPTSSLEIQELETQESVPSHHETSPQAQSVSTIPDHEETKLAPSFNLDAPILKEKIANSGVFMESKIATLEGATPEMVEEQMGNDVKSQLLELHEELQASPSLENTQLQLKIDELLTHIDYHQLLSHLSNSNSLYFPFAWDGLEKGALEFKKSKGEKSYCEINLTLKEHGDVDLFLGLRDENVLDIKIHTQTPQFKQLLQTHIDELRTSLKDANLILRSVRIFDETQRLTQSVKAYETTQDETYDGFEVTI